MVWRIWSRLDVVNRLCCRFAGEAVRNYGDVIPAATKNMRNVVRLLFQCRTVLFSDNISRSSNKEWAFVD